MKKITKTLLIMLAAAMAVPTAVNAQDPYDDLYYSPAKAEKKKKAEEERIAKLRAQTLPAADTYTSGSDKPLNVDVDTYNRRVAPFLRIRGLGIDGLLLQHSLGAGHQHLCNQ